MNSTVDGVSEPGREAKDTKAVARTEALLPIAPLVDPKTDAWRTFTIGDCGKGQDLLESSTASAPSQPPEIAQAQMHVLLKQLQTAAPPWRSFSSEDPQLPTLSLLFPPVRWLGALAVIDSYRSSLAPSPAPSRGAGGEQRAADALRRDRLLDYSLVNATEVTKGRVQACARARGGRGMGLGGRVCGVGLPLRALVMIQHGMM